MSRKALGMGLGLSALLAPPQGANGPRTYVADGKQASSFPLPIQAQGEVRREWGEGSSHTAQGIDVDKIVPNRYQPRTYFDEASLNTLSQSIKQHGFIQPIVVRPSSENKYELIAGERRWRAATLAGITEIPAIIKEIDDQTAMEYALLENLQREDLNPIERARAYARLLSEFSLTQEEVSERVGIDRSSVANTLRLLNLPETIRKDIAEGAISMGHAKVLLALETVELQLQFAQQIKSQGLSIRQLTTMVTAASKKKKTASKAVTGKIPPYIVDLENQILHALGTKVRVIPASGGSGGEIKISYYSLDDLDRILEKLLNSSYENNVNGTDVA